MSSHVFDVPSNAARKVRNLAMSGRSCGPYETLEVFMDNVPWDRLDMAKVTSLTFVL